MITPILIYFLKVNLALAFLYICYRLLFRDDTFFRLRRGVLLSIYLIAFLYPLPDLSGWLSTQTSVAGIVGYYSGLLPKETVLTASNEIAASNWKEAGLKVMQVIWLAGAGLLLSRCLAELFTVSRLHRKCRKITLNGTEVCILPEAEASYSFFGWIFISSDPHQRERLDDILIHEQTHVRQWHSIDMMAGEIICIACWLNPFAWWLKKEIGINHEFIADEQVMLAGFDKKEYQYHLIGVKHPNTAIANLYNNFSVLPLKKRITMLNKKRTNGVGKVKYLALVPMAAAMLLFNNIDVMARIVNNQTTEKPKAAAVVTTPEIVPTVIEEAPLPPDDDKVYTVCDVMPEFPGGQDKLLQYLASSIKYPAEAIEKKEEGRVTLSYIVEKDGSISNVEVIRSVSPSLDAEAIRIVKAMPKWTPAKSKGEIVRVKYTVPVTFRMK